MIRSLAAIALAAAAGAAQAQATVVGDWVIGLTSGEPGFYAAAVNDSGAVLGKYCLEEGATCMWLFNTRHNTCRDGESYPVMVNADNGSFSTNLLCVPLEGRARMVFEDDAAIENGVRASQQIGLAYPLSSGEFAISRFNTRRGDAALAVLSRLSAVLARPASAHAGLAPGK